MMFLAPLSGLIAASITVPLLVLLYFLKLRRREVPVSSTLLWRQALEDMQVNSPFQRLRRNLLLLLQLLALGALLTALARPSWPSPALSGQRLIIMVDHSASMNATDVSPSRLERAKELALAAVENFRGPGGVMIVSLAKQTRVVQPFTTDRSLLRAAVRSIEPTDEPSDWSAAVAMIEPYAQSEKAEGTGDLQVLIFSDGGARNLPAILPHVPTELVFIGESAEGSSGRTTPDNLAITAFSARRDFLQPQKVQVFARLNNFGTQPVTTHISLAVDEQVQKVVTVMVPAAQESGPDGSPGPAGTGTVEFQLHLPGSAVLRIRHDHADHLTVDNTAWLVLAPPRRARALLVSSGNPFLELALQAAGVQELKIMSPAEYERATRVEPPEKRFDLAVFDRFNPAALPAVNSAFWGCLPPVPGLELRHPREGPARTVRLLDWDRDHPLLRYAVLDDVLLADRRHLVLPTGTRISSLILATAEQGPVLALVSDREHGEHQYVVAAFDLLQTNWPMQVSFQVFISNLVEYLMLSGTGQAGLSASPGDVVTVPVRRPEGAVVYEGPQRIEATAQQERCVLPPLRRTGLYRETTGLVLPPWDLLAVNLLEAGESDLRVPGVGALKQGDSRPVQAQSAVRWSRQEIWRWFVGAAMLILVLEWLVYLRRMSF